MNKVKVKKTPVKIAAGKHSVNKRGLSESEAKQKLLTQRKALKLIPPWQNDAYLLLSQFKSPLVLLLVVAAILSLVLGEYSDSLIVLVILLATGLLGFVQERNAGKAVDKLRQMVHTMALVRRDGKEREIPIEDVVEGDIVILNAGDIIPSDAFIIESNDLHLNESVLTGESFPVEKFAGEFKAGMKYEDKNLVLQGTSVINGSAIVVTIATAGSTQLGMIASSLELSAARTSFEMGIMHFGYLLMRITVILTVLILVANMLFHKPFMESLLFSLALTVGLAPELLPAILTINLSAGAKRMARKKVIVKKLSAMQNLGEMDILCCDKTGTLTEGIVELKSALDVNGKPGDKIALYGYLNAFFETGFSNPIDEALRKSMGATAEAYKKYDEVPYDFNRKRLSVVVGNRARHLMITKGAFENVLEVCSHYESSDGGVKHLHPKLESLKKQFYSYSGEGFRTIAVAWKDVTGDPVINKDDENDMVFLGYLLFFDPPKKGIIDSINDLKKTGIKLKLITGDNHLVAKHVGEAIGLKTETILRGAEINLLTMDALEQKVKKVDVFAEILPAQKERIVMAMKKSGHSVGFLGDGINDANALKAADVGISINNAVDVAKEAADIVLLDQNIEVVREGVLEGRKTFMNTMKYIYLSTSANFGNMFSMAVASLFLPFFPLLPIQILLNNFLSDIPAFAIASDRVDAELIKQPRTWNFGAIRKFMLVFGLQSSLFDFATFALLIYYFKASATEFRTGWFMESLLTEILILLVIRTGRPFYKSRPSSLMISAVIFCFILSLTIPYLPIASVFSLSPLPFTLVWSLLGLVMLYFLGAELIKRLFKMKI